MWSTHEARQKQPKAPKNLEAKTRFHHVLFEVDHAEPGCSELLLLRTLTPMMTTVMTSKPYVVFGYGSLIFKVLACLSQYIDSQ